MSRTLLIPYFKGALYGHHREHDFYKWEDLITVAVDVAEGRSDIDQDTPGRNMNHPKAYVGFFSHSAYHRKDDSIAVNGKIHSYEGNGWPRLLTTVRNVRGGTGSRIQIR